MNTNSQKNLSVAGFSISKPQSKTVKFRLDEDLHAKEKNGKPQRGRDNRASAVEYADFQ